MILLLACNAATGPTQAQLVAEALERREPGLCAGLSSALARGDCQLAAGADCEAVEPGPFQFECRFRLAESMRDEDAAVSLCGRTGPYSGDCYTHLFQDFENLDLSPGVRFDEALEVAESRALQYERLGSGGWGPPWGWFWRRLFEEQSVIDLDQCLPYVDEDLRRCLRGAASMLQLAWRRELSTRPRAWCGLELEEVHATARARGGLAWTREPRLDAVVRAELEGCPETR